MVFVCFNLSRTFGGSGGVNSFLQYTGFRYRNSQDAFNSPHPTHYKHAPLFAIHRTRASHFQIFNPTPCPRSLNPTTLAPHRPPASLWPPPQSLPFVPLRPHRRIHTALHPFCRSTDRANHRFYSYLTPLTFSPFETTHSSTLRNTCTCFFWKK